MVPSEIAKLGYFFGCCPLYVNKDHRQLSLFPPHEIVLVVDFREEKEDLESLVKKALSWVGRRKFVEFGINGIPADRQRWEEIPVKGKYRKLVGKAVKPLNLYRAEARNPVYLFNREQEAEALVEQWNLTRKIPEEIRNLWMDSDEDQAKLQSMVGRQVYKANDNKGYGRKLQTLIHHHKQKYRTSRKAREAFWKGWKSQPKLGPLKIRELGVIASLPASFIPGEFTEEYGYTAPSQEKIETAITALAQAAYEIRMSYPCKGNSVRDGLVHIQDYGHLYELVRKQCDREILCRILANGLGEFTESGGETFWSQKWEAEAEGDVRFVVAASMECSHRVRPHPPEKYSLTPNDYQRIGYLRVGEFLQKRKIPYAREARTITKILTMYLNRKQFQREVNLWLEKHRQERVHWEELEFTRKAA